MRNILLLASISLHLSNFLISWHISVLVPISYQFSLKESETHVFLSLSWRLHIISSIWNGRWDSKGITLSVVREGDFAYASICCLLRMNMYVKVVVINHLMASFVMVNSAEDKTGETGERSYYIHQNNCTPVQRLNFFSSCFTSSKKFPSLTVIYWVQTGTCFTLSNNDCAQ